MTSSTLALDALMQHPRFPEYVEMMRQAVPVGLMDQADSAASDAHRLLTTIAGYVGVNEGRAMPAAEVPDWLRLGLLDAFTGYANGTARSCRHSPDPWRPAPVVAAAWMPSLITCSDCVHLFALTPGSVKDQTCDACGRRCDDGPIHPGAAQLGPLLYRYGTCIDCRPPVTSGSPLRATETAERTPSRGRARVRTHPRRKRRR